MYAAYRLGMIPPGLRTTNWHSLAVDDGLVIEEHDTDLDVL